MSRTLDILGVKFTVEEVDTVCKEYPRRGEINYLTNEIKIDKTMSKTAKNQTLMHEIMHEVFDLLGFDELRDDESKVQAIATALHQIFTTQDVFERYFVSITKYDPSLSLSMSKQKPESTYILPE